MFCILLVYYSLNAQYAGNTGLGYGIYEFISAIAFIGIHHQLYFKGCFGSLMPRPSVGLHFLVLKGRSIVATEIFWFAVKNGVSLSKKGTNFISKVYQQC